MEKTMEKFKRIFVIVIDSVGIGEMPDAERFGDKGTNTFVHTAERCGGLNVPNMNSLGLGDLADIKIHDLIVTFDDLVHIASPFVKFVGVLYHNEWVIFGTITFFHGAARPIHQSPAAWPREQRGGFPPDKPSPSRSRRRASPPPVYHRNPQSPG